MSSVATYQFSSRYFRVLFGLCAFFTHVPRRLIQVKGTYRQITQAHRVGKNVLLIRLNKNTTDKRKLIDMKQNIHLNSEKVILVKFPLHTNAK